MLFFILFLIVVVLAFAITACRAFDRWYYYELELRRRKNRLNLQRQSFPRVNQQAVGGNDDTWRTIREQQTALAPVAPLTYKNSPYTECQEVLNLTPQRTRNSSRDTDAFTYRNRFGKSVIQRCTPNFRDYSPNFEPVAHTPAALSQNKSSCIHSIDELNSRKQNTDCQAEFLPVPTPIVTAIKRKFSCLEQDLLPGEELPNSKTPAKRRRLSGRSYKHVESGTLASIEVRGFHTDKEIIITNKRGHFSFYDSEDEAVDVLPNGLYSQAADVLPNGRYRKSRTREEAQRTGDLSYYIAQFRGEAAAHYEDEDYNDSKTQNNSITYNDWNKPLPPEPLDDTSSKSSNFYHYNVDLTEQRLKNEVDQSYLNTFATSSESDLKVQPIENPIPVYFDETDRETNIESTPLPPSYFERSNYKYSNFESFHNLAYAGDDTTAPVPVLEMNENLHYYNYQGNNAGPTSNSSGNRSYEPTSFVEGQQLINTLDATTNESYTPLFQNNWNSGTANFTTVYAGFEFSSIADTNNFYCNTGLGSVTDPNPNNSFGYPFNSSSDSCFATFTTSVIDNNSEENNNFEFIDDPMDTSDYDILEEGKEITSATAAYKDALLDLSALKLSSDQDFTTKAVELKDLLPDVSTLKLGNDQDVSNKLVEDKYALPDFSALNLYNDQDVTTKAVEHKDPLPDVTTLKLGNDQDVTNKLVEDKDALPDVSILKLGNDHDVTNKLVEDKDALPDLSILKLGNDQANNIEGNETEEIDNWTNWSKSSSTSPSETPPPSPTSIGEIAVGCTFTVK